MKKLLITIALLCAALTAKASTNSNSIVTLTYKSGTNWVTITVGHSLTNADMTWPSFTNRYQWDGGLMSVPLESPPVYHPKPAGAYPVMPMIPGDSPFVIPPFNPGINMGDPAGELPGGNPIVFPCYIEYDLGWGVYLYGVAWDNQAQAYACTPVAWNVPE